MDELGFAVPLPTFFDLQPERLRKIWYSCSESRRLNWGGDRPLVQKWQGSEAPAQLLQRPTTASLGIQYAITLNRQTGIPD